MIPLGITAAQALQGISDAPDVPTSGLLYWLESDFGLFKGDGTVPVSDLDDPISRWVNRGSAGAVVQSVEANRPLYIDPSLDGLGIGLIGSDVAAGAHFEDLAFSQPSGDGYNPWTCIVVTDSTFSGNQRPSFLGSGTANGKMDFYAWTDMSVPAPGSLNVAGIWVGEATGLWAEAGTFVARAEIVSLGPDVHVNVRLDGAQIADVTDAPGSSAAVASTQFLRNSAYDPLGYFNRGIYAVLFYDRYLSDAEVEQIEAYLAAKYPL